MLMAEFWLSILLLVAVAAADGLLFWFVLSYRRAEWVGFKRLMSARLGRPFSLLSFRETRRLVRRQGNLVPAILVGAAYTIASMLIGSMLEVFPSSRLAFFWEVIWYGHPSWDYPALLIAGPNEVIAFPFLPTITMAIVALGVAFGGGVAIASIRAQLRAHRRKDGVRSAVSATAGISSGITGLATLGACCCVTCATAGGVAIVAAASGASYSDLLTNNWYIDLFQVVVVWFSLLIQEWNLRRPVDFCPPPRDARTVASVALRVGLLVSGITWSLAMFAEWSFDSPLSAPAGTWFHWIFEHQLLSCVAVLAAMMPRETMRTLIARSRTTSVRGLRVALAVAAITWGAWVPVQLTSLGLGGFVNELFGYLGFPASWGSISPDSPLGGALVFHWTFQHLFLSAFALTAALWPSRAATPLLWSVEERRAVKPGTVIGLVSAIEGSHLIPSAPTGVSEVELSAVAVPHEIAIARASRRTLGQEATLERR